MILKLILAVGLIAVLWFIAQKYKKLPAPQRKNLVLKILLFGLGGILLLGVVTGRMHWFGAVIAALLPLFRFGLHTVFRFLPLWLNRTGGAASFKTEHLDVQVVVQTGQLRGRIIKGPHTEKTIEQLTDTDLQELENYYRDRDNRSYYLIKFARKSANFSGGRQQQAPSFANPSREEALQILGLTGNPTQEEIIVAHRRLINKLHPDRGGSDFLAARVNQARDILLDGK